MVKIGIHLLEVIAKINRVSAFLDHPVGLYNCIALLRCRFFRGLFRFRYFRQ